MKIDPLEEKLRGRRFLSDKGIKQAIDAKLLNFNNEHLDVNDSRLQPATIDISLDTIMSSSESKSKIWYTYLINPQKQKLHPKSTNQVIFQEMVSNINDFEEREYVNYLRKIMAIRPLSSFRAFNFFVDLKSKLRRLGGCVEKNIFYLKEESEYNYFEKEASSKIKIDLNVLNYSHNYIKINEGDKIAQLFIGVNPFLTAKTEATYTLLKKVKKKKIIRSLEEVRSLDMGVEITTDEQLNWLAKEGYLEISPEMKIKNGKILVHAANTATKLKNMDETINFSEINKYHYELYEKIILKKNHIIQLHEHLDIDTVETLKLSPYVGIQFHINKASEGYCAWPEGEQKINLFREYHLAHENEHNFENKFFNIFDGWVDPGYEGPFSRQIRGGAAISLSPGDVIGYGTVIFYPNGVARPYGSSGLNSHYQDKK